MRRGSRVREFFQGGGVISTKPDGALPRIVAGLGLAAMVSLLPTAQLDATGDRPIGLPAFERPAPGEVRTFLVSEADATVAAHIAEVAENSTIHRYGDYAVPHAVAKAIVRAAKETDFPADYLMAIAEKESSFRAGSKAEKGTAKGYFGFIEQTWLSAVKRNGAEYGLGDAASSIVSKKNKRGQTYLDIEDDRLRAEVLDLRDDPYVSAVMAANDLKDARKRIEARIDAVMEDKDLYLPHFLGEDAAEDIIAASEKRPNTTARAMLPKATRFNKSMFHDRGGRPLTVAQFRERARNVIAVRAEKYADVDLDIEKASRVPAAGAITGTIRSLPNEAKEALHANAQTYAVAKR